VAESFSAKNAWMALSEAVGSGAAGATISPEIQART
jgi:hypothetical protein